MQLTEVTQALPLDKEGILRIQSVVGKFLYYALALDCAMLTALSNIGSQQSLPTQKVKKAVQQLLDYANTYKTVFLKYYASDI